MPRFPDVFFALYSNTSGEENFSMQISDHIYSGGLALALKVRMDFQARKTFQGAIENAKCPSPQRGIANFSTALSWRAGLGLLMLASKCLEEAKIRLSLEIPEGYILQFLTIANIGKNISITTTKAQPLASGFSGLGTTPRNV